MYGAVDNKTKTFSKWYWSNTMFNEHFYTENDFSNLQPNLTFNIDPGYYSTALTEDLTLIKDSDKNINLTDANILKLKRDLGSTVYIQSLVSF